jgi:hypothetical protein
VQAEPAASAAASAMASVAASAGHHPALSSALVRFSSLRPGLPCELRFSFAVE